MAADRIPAQFIPAKTPPEQPLRVVRHYHDDVDSPRIDPSNLLGFKIFTVGDATIAPIDDASSGSIRFQFDGVNLTEWFRGGQVWYELTSPPSVVIPGGSSTDVQFNDGGSFGGDSGFTYTTATTTLTIKNIKNSAVSNDLNLSAHGNLSVLANGTGSSQLTLVGVGFVDMASPAGSILIRAQGAAGTTSLLRLRSANGNLSFGAENTFPNFGGGVGVFFLENSTTAPTTTPTGGGVLYSSAGALHWLGTSGTDTIIAPA